jgi:NAD(P)-dependent dehydrogenase (short-subunit alcohol dehydrogenase family)
MNRVKGKVAIVTGAGQGIGKAEALLLSKEGAAIVVTDINEATGNRVVKQIKKDGGKAIYVKHDIASEASWEEVINKTVAEFGKLDVLVNNAGVFFESSLEETSLEKWRWLMSINLDGVFLGIKHAIGAMKRTGGGSIINTSSAGGMVGTIDTAAYCASKGAVWLLTKAAALECSKAGHNYNIRVNSVHPGAIKTALNESLRKDPVGGKALLSWHPIGHLGETEDIAYGVLYLASDESKFATGSALVIDGGWTVP